MWPTTTSRRTEKNNDPLSPAAGGKHIDSSKDELTPEDTDCKPLTDEEFAEFQKAEKRKERTIGGIISAIWDAISFFL